MHVCFGVLYMLTCHAFETQASNERLYQNLLNNALSMFNNVMDTPAIELLFFMNVIEHGLIFRM